MARKKPNGPDDGNGIGHNNATTELTAAERKTLFMHHYRKITAQAAKVKIEADYLKELRKLAKADTIVLSDIDFAVRCAKVDNSEIIPEEIKRHIEIAQFFALPVGQQTEMDFDREPANDKAKREGTAAFFAGSPREPTQYAPDSRSGQAYMKAWDAAEATEQSDLASAFQKKNALRDMMAAQETSAEAMPPE